MVAATRSLVPRWELVLLAVLAAGLPRPAAAAWPPDPLINVPLCVTPYSSQVGAAVSDGKGGAIVVWHEDRAGDFDVFARRVRFDGTPLWTANGVTLCITATTTFQVLPRAVSDGAGGAIVGWFDNRNGANSLFFQRVDSTGTLLWGASGVSAATSASNQLTGFTLVADGTGGVVAAWSTSQNGGQNDIYAQRLNASGVAQWGVNAKALCTDPADQLNPVLERTAAGNFVVAWEDNRRGFRNDVYGMSLSGTGTLQWLANGLLLAGSAENAANPMLVASGPSDCLLFWDADTLGLSDIRGQRLSSTGAAMWAGAGVRMFPAGANGILGAVTDQVGGAYLVMARPDAATGRSPLWVQRVQNTGDLLFGAAAKRASSILSNQFQVVLAPDNAAGLLMTWYDDQRRLTPNVDIIAQRFSPFGDTPWSASGIPVCRAPNTGPGLVMVPNGTSGAVIAWSDTRNSPAPDIYAQGVTAAGELGPNVGVDPTPAPGATALARPAPNPLPHGRATISYTVARTERIELRVVDPAGRVVRVLEDGVRGPGTYQVEWDGRTGDRRLAPGLYLVQLLTPTRNEIRRLVLL